MEPLGIVSQVVSVISAVNSLITAVQARQDWETVKSQVGGLTSEAAIATFLAAVQAQIIALTYQDNSTHLKSATNALGFAGVLLDVITAFLALLASTILQRHITVIEQQLDAIEDASPEQMEDFLQEIEFTEMSPDIFRRVLAKMEDRRQQSPQQTVEGQPHRLAQSARLDPRAIPKSLKHIQGAAPLGDAAGTAMLFGLLCFFASVISLAISTQPRAVWIVSVSVTSLVLALPMINGLFRWVGIRLPNVFEM